MELPKIDFVRGDGKNIYALYFKTEQIENCAVNVVLDRALGISFGTEYIVCPQVLNALHVYLSGYKNPISLQTILIAAEKHIMENEDDKDNTAD